MQWEILTAHVRPVKLWRVWISWLDKQQMKFQLREMNRFEGIFRLVYHHTALTSWAFNIQADMFGGSQLPSTIVVKITIRWYSPVPPVHTTYQKGWTSQFCPVVQWSLPRTSYVSKSHYATPLPWGCVWTAPDVWLDTIVVVTSHNIYW